MVSDFYSSEFDEENSDSKNFIQKSKLIIGAVFIFFSIFFLFSSISFYFTGTLDFDLMTSNISALNAGQEVQNWLGYFGAFISHYLIFEGVGISSIFLVPIFLSIGSKLVFKDFSYSVFNILAISFFSIFWITVLLGFLWKIRTIIWFFLEKIF